ncbi:MAG: pgl [Ferruginibacter sp.]|uniref:6-phosphogluconolactonase n=1 Tax=Ferruginibacter sp. TaxID=1940288 RepID=UPI002659A0EC|nr:6-phosphogluconolactonase [Ferruginibacter sp.]MDB5276288.1 pgl [Ferruginibacter sp.]
MGVKINIYKTEDEVLNSLANYFVIVANQAITANGKFTVALSGGNSPKKLYQLLSSQAYKEQVQWAKVFFFFGDERNVPQTDPDSNYLMAKKTLFDPLQINEANIFPVNTDLEPELAAGRYTDAISRYFAGKEMKFDLVLLGLGDNAHTASLFPHTPILQDRTVSVKAVFLEEQQVYRISFTAPLINLAHHIAFLVYGQTKAAAVKNILETNKNIDKFPAQLIAPVTGTLDWFLDESAASVLENVTF